MKIKNLIFICTLSHSLTYTMHIKDLTTIVPYEKEELSVFKLLRDYRHSNFGRTPIFNTCAQEPFFKQNTTETTEDTKTETITTLSHDNLLKISKGKAIYCHEVYKDTFVKNAIICCQDTDEISEPFIHQTYNKFLFYLLTIAYEKDRLEKQT